MASSNKTTTTTTRSPKPAGAAARKPAKPAGAASSGRGTKASAASDATASSAAPGSKRTAYVFASLVGVMGMTAVLLWATRSAPLLPDASMSLRAIDDGPRGLDVVFDTKAPLQAGRWKYVFVHHSNTPGGNAGTLAEAPGAGPADHFVIGNGDGLADGEIQIGQRWNRQQAAGAIAGLDKMSPDCVSVCVVGDLDRRAATPLQAQRLAQLVTALQQRLRIGRERVWVVDATDSRAGIGRMFPKAQFREQLLP